jgi:AraC-like DNA-binding protein
MDTKMLLHNSSHLLGLDISAVGSVSRRGNQGNMLARKLNSFGVVYLHGGRGSFKSEATSGKVGLEAGMVFFLIPGLWHIYGPGVGQTWKEHWMLFDGFIPQQYLNSGLISAGNPFRYVGSDRKLLKLWERVINNARGAATDSQQEAALAGFGILSRILRYSCLPAGRRHDAAQTVESAIKLMLSRISDPDFSLQANCDQLYSSYSALRKAFKTQTGRSPARWFSEQKMRTAAARLVSSHDQVKKIAAQVGFLDPYHFSRRFKTITGVSPDAYRKTFGPDFS